MERCGVVQLCGFRIPSTLSLDGHTRSSGLSLELLLAQRLLFSELLRNFPPSPKQGEDKDGREVNREAEQSSCHTDQGLVLSKTMMPGTKNRLDPSAAKAGPVYKYLRTG